MRKLRSRASWIVTLAVLLSCGITRGGDDYVRGVLLPGLGSATLVRVELDERIYERTRGQLERLRVRDSRGRDLPRIVESLYGTSSERVTESWDGTVVSASRKDDGALVIECSSPDDRPLPDSVTIRSPLKNFQQVVQTEFQTKNGEWKSAGPEATLVDLSEFVSIREDRIALKVPKDSQRKFRLTILNPQPDVEARFREVLTRSSSNGDKEKEERSIVGRQPFRIDGLRFERTRTKEVPNHLLTTEWQPEMSFSNDTRTKQTSLMVLVGHRPMSELRLVSKETNFSQPAVIRSLVEGRSLQVVAKPVFEKIDIGEFHKEAMTYKWPSPVDVRLLEIDLPYTGSTAVSMDRCMVVSPRQTVTFVAEPDRTYQLVCPAFDDRPVVPVVNASIVKKALEAGEKPVDANLGDEANVPPPKPWFRWKGMLADPIVATSVVSVLAIVLVIVLLRTSRKLGDNPPQT